MANGKVTTGFSMPRVAIYSATGNTVTYSDGMPLARGVDVSLDVESSDASNFYADNIAAESIGGQFTGGTVTLNVDGLKEEARKLILGITATSTVTVDSKTVSVIDYDDTMSIPYVGLGFVVRYMENGVTTYAPVVFPKVAFDVDGMEAATQEEEIEFQTQELTATIMRDDTVNHRWRRIAADQTSEADAVAVLNAMLNIV